MSDETGRWDHVAPRPSTIRKWEEQRRRIEEERRASERHRRAVALVKFRAELNAQREARKSASARFARFGAADLSPGNTRLPSERHNGLMWCGRMAFENERVDA